MGGSAAMPGTGATVRLRRPPPSRRVPLNEGNIASSAGLDIDASEFEQHFHEEQVAHSHALHSRLDGQPYLVGPLARYALNADRLSPIAREAARDAGLEPVCRNPFQSIIIRSVEILYACDEALRLIEEYEPPDRPFVDVAPGAGEGWACTEAPRGLLYHRYRLDAQGLILDARIVPPTAQNQPTIEEDLRQFIPAHLGLSRGDLRWRCEQVVRNYDPCISCATHYLNLEIDRT